MQIYHYTNIDKLKTIAPSFFGQNYYTQNDVSACNVKRSFFYTERGRHEISLQGAKFCYTAEVKEKNIYDIQKDVSGYFKKYNSITEAVLAISRRYKGIIYSYNNYKIVSLFVSIPCKKISSI